MARQNAPIPNVHVIVQDVKKVSVEDPVREPQVESESCQYVDSGPFAFTRSTATRRRGRTITDVLVAIEEAKQEIPLAVHLLHIP
jgi:hypothetical protein